MTAVLVLNSGSSSLKYRLIEMADESVRAHGLIERIGGAGLGAIRHDSAAGRYEHEAPIPDHSGALKEMLRTFAVHGPDLTPAAIGHRVVHGGERFSAPALVTHEVLTAIDELADLAPLHNPPGLLGIRAAQEAFPAVPHVAVFDTAFHRTVPAEASTYAIDAAVAGAHGIRRYGFHGTSHRYVSAAAAQYLGQPLADVKLIVLHLGNGASACAVSGGRSVATSMGLTPLEGLVMGTRGGDLDPGAVLHLLRAGFSVDDVDQLLNRRSGLLGLTGLSDMRDVQAAAGAGDERATLALGVYAHRLRHYIGAYFALLGGLDAVVFTAGVGENSPPVRAAAVAGLEHLGIDLDEDANQRAARGPRRISADSSAVAVLVVPTDEELEIARQVLTTVG